MAETFGLDFGTTTTLAAFVQNNRVNILVNREDDLPHPSAVWYAGGEEIVLGRKAKNQLTQPRTGIVGDVVRSLKPFLGKGTDVHVGGVARKPVDVVGKFLSFIKKVRVVNVIWFIRPGKKINSKKFELID